MTPESLPIWRSWFKPQSMFLLGGYVIGIALGLVGLVESTNPNIFVGLLISSVTFFLFGLLAVADQERERIGLHGNIARNLEVVERNCRMTLDHLAGLGQLMAIAEVLNHGRL